MNCTRLKSRSSVKTKTLFGLACAAHGVEGAEMPRTIAARISIVEGRIGPRSIAVFRL